MKTRTLLALATFLLTASAHAQVPQIINYQGRVAVSNAAATVNFDGTGQFKFALVNATGTTTYWSNDGSSIAGSQPAAAVSLTVAKGLYSVLLGDTSLTNMTAIPASVWTNADVRLRVWFNDGTNGSQLLAPDQRLAPNGYLPDGSVSSNALAANAVTSAKIANAAVGSSQLAPASVLKANLASGAVDVGNILTGIAPANGQVLSFNGTGLNWITPAGGGGGTLTLPYSQNGSISGTGALFSINNSSSGASILGASASGIGVYGTTNVGSGSAAGIWGETSAPAGTGIVGKSLSVAGTGVYGISSGAITGFPAGTGVVGESPVGGTGVRGNSSGTWFDGFSFHTGVGVWGQSDSGYGVYGASQSGTAIYATSQGGTGVNATSQNGAAVNATSVNGNGVYASSASGDAIYGQGAASGIHGVSTNNLGNGVEGSATTGNGVRGVSTSNSGVYGTTSAAGVTIAGVFGENSAAGGTAVVGSAGNVNSAGVAGVADSAGSTGVYGRGAKWGGYFDGNVRVVGAATVNVLTINGGSDLAEPFQMSSADVPKGTVMVIDEENAGWLKPSTQSYDTRVAGIVSGARGINPGITLHQEGMLEGGQNVALSGRVYVLADASNGAIKPGDLLTTSEIPGEAMKVTDHTRAQGAIIGKAMSPLDEGTGMILVLVTLQ